ncbi:MAG TPA: nuclear transport factor 2 family protein [Acidobacteriota bacterium]|nr:nuclear transport factor 2 family protein [Acidobacteriota bacterium]
MQKIVFINLFVISMIAVILIGGTVPGYVGIASAEKRNAVESRLQQLEDREAIRQLLTDYGRFLDQRDFASFSQLFAEKDGEWDGGMGKARGPQEIRKLMESTIGKSGEKAAAPNFHIFTNQAIHVNGDRADATTKWIFVVQGDANRPQPLYLGHYEDSLVREGGRWKFLRRVVHSDIPGDEALSKK